jgi:hypothetical protein
MALQKQGLRVQQLLEEALPGERTGGGFTRWELRGVWGASYGIGRFGIHVGVRDSTRDHFWVPPRPSASCVDHQLESSVENGQSARSTRCSSVNRTEIPAG